MLLVAKRLIMKFFKLLILISIFFTKNQGLLADCLVTEAERYSYLGEYGKSTMNLSFIDMDGDALNCLYIPGYIKISVENIVTGEQEVNFKCNDDIWLKTSRHFAKPSIKENHSKYSLENITLVAKGKSYATENLGNRQTSNNSNYIKTRISCTRKSMIEDTLIKFKIKNIDKRFSIRRIVVTEIFK